MYIVRCLLKIQILIFFLIEILNKYIIFTLKSLRDSEFELFSQ